MKKAFKLVAGFVALVVVVLAGSSLLLRVLLPPEKAKALVLKQLTTHLRREVRLGDVSVGVLSGISVSKLEVSEAPDFSKGTFLSSDQFTLHVKLLPLLFRKVIGQLILRHPMITVVRNPDGKTYNFSDLMTSSEPPASNAPAGSSTAAAKEKPSFSLLIPRAEIDKGVVRFVDRSPEARSIDIDPIDLKLRNVSLVAPFTLQASLKAKAKKTEVDLQLAAEANLLDGSVKLKTCTVTSAGTKLSLVGRATALRSGKPTADITLDIKELSLASLKPFASLPPEIQVNGPITGSAHVKGDQSALNFDALIGLTGADVAYGSLFKKPSKTAFTLASKGSVQNMELATITNLDLVLGAIKLSGHGTVKGLSSPQPTIALHTESNSFGIEELAHYVAGLLPKDLTMKGNTSFSADVSGTAASSQIAAKWQGTDLSITKADQFVKPAGIPLQVALIGEMLNTQQTFVFRSLTAKLASLEAKGEGAYKMAGAGSVTLALKTNQWNVKDVAGLVPSLSAYQPSGTASIDVRASGSPSAPALNGSLGLQDVSARYERSTLSRLTGVAAFTQQDVTLSKLTGQLNGADFTMKLTGRRLTTQPDMNIDANFTALDLDKILPPVASAPAPTAFLFVAPAYAAAPPASTLGPMKVVAHLVVGNIKHELYQAQNLDFSCNLTDITSDLSRVSGSANLKQGAGVLQNLEKLAALSKGAKIALLPIATLQKLDKRGLLKKMGLPSLQSITFTSVRGSYLLNMGTMDIQNFELDGQQLDLQTKGTVGLAGAQPLNMRVTMKLASGLIGGDVGRLLQDESGRATLNFTASGSVADPSVKLELQEVGKRAVQQFGGQLLKGLGIGQQAPANQPPASNNAAPGAPAAPAPNPIDDLQKSLKNIFH